MEQYYTGEVVSLYFEHRDSGALVDATTSAKIAIEDSSGQVVIAATTALPGTGTTGKYQYGYAIDAAAKTGVYTAQATFTNGSDINKEGTINFTVEKKIG